MIRLFVDALSFFGVVFAFADVAVLAAVFSAVVGEADAATTDAACFRRSAAELVLLLTRGAGAGFGVGIGDRAATTHRPSLLTSRWQASDVASDVTSDVATVST